ncbi:MAG TPA: serine/threonine-protein kinase, partial [Labilithrix sp.]|nr:serine/threonine-protein kinase [Labilithrix sp.]
MSTSSSKSNSAPKGFEAESRILAKTTVRPGDVYGRYQLLVPVAAGGMGTVWAARQLGHPQFKRLVALKIAHDNLTLDEEYRKMFLDEARLASSVQHPNVCSVVDMGEEAGRLFLVMEWMAGSVRELVGKVPKRVLAPNIAARVIADACAGLHSAHELHDEKGVPIELIHRDISPDNILFSIDGRVKVTDFGIARARDQMHKKTETGEMKGKISYMAPEQIKSKHYDRRVDIFALGCVLYRATVGKKAFDGSSATVIYDILESRFSRPHEVHPNFNAGLERGRRRGRPSDAGNLPRGAHGTYSRCDGRSRQLDLRCEVDEQHPGHRRGGDVSRSEFVGGKERCSRALRRNADDHDGAVVIGEESPLGVGRRSGIPVRVSARRVRALAAAATARCARCGCCFGRHQCAGSERDADERDGGRGRIDDGGDRHARRTIHACQCHARPRRWRADGASFPARLPTRREQAPAQGRRTWAPTRPSDRDVRRVRGSRDRASAHREDARTDGRRPCSP